MTEEQVTNILVGMEEDVFVFVVVFNFSKLKLVFNFYLKSSK